jgi:hypothetical protein
MSPGGHRVDGETGLYLYVSPDGQIRRWIFRFTSPVTKRVTETGLDMAAAEPSEDQGRRLTEADRGGHLPHPGQARRTDIPGHVP